MIQVEHKVVITLEITKEEAKAFRNDLRYVLDEKKDHTVIATDLHELLSKSFGVTR